MGRPSSYTPEIAEIICDRLASGTPLTTLCRESDDLPNVVTVLKWIRDFPEFAQLYSRARECCIELMAHEISEIADTSREGVKVERKEIGRCCSVCRRWVAWLHGRWAHAKEDTPLCDGAEAEKIIEEKTMTADMVERSKLQVDARKWLLSKMAPHKYGERPAVAVNIDMRAELEKQLEQIAFNGDQKLIEQWRAGEPKEPGK
jgi:hypothetical protein